MTERTHKPYHERNLDQQMLDALIRIEEQLIRLAAITHYNGLPMEPAAPANPEPGTKLAPAKGKKWSKA